MSDEPERAREHHRYLIGRLRGEKHRRENAERERDAALAAIEQVLNLTGDIGPEARRILSTFLERRAKEGAK